MSPDASYSQSTLCVHADDALNAPAPSTKGRITDVAPALHVSTTFRFPEDPDDLREAKDVDVSRRGRPLSELVFLSTIGWLTRFRVLQLFTHDTHVYSRETTPNTTRLESILSSITNGRALCYSSGLSALFAAYTHLRPNKISIGGGYHGTHGVISIHNRMYGVQKLPLDCPEEELGKGDVIHIETPFNPTGEVFDLNYYADKAHRRGAILVVDATFAPPGLQGEYLPMLLACAGRSVLMLIVFHPLFRSLQTWSRYRHALWDKVLWWPL